MAAHWVICKHCGIRFDRDKEEFEAVKGRRYVHKKCYEEYKIIEEKEAAEYAALEDYIKQVFHLDVLTAKIKRQIGIFRKEYNYTYTGMLKTLQWWYGIKQNTLEKANDGIGIVPFVYQDAHNYYYSLYLASCVNSMIPDETSLVKNVTVEIESPQIERKKPKLFNLEV